MTEAPFGRTLYPLALILWLGAFGWRAAALSRAAADLSRQTDRVEGAAAGLDRGSRRLAALSRDASAQSRDAEFLEGLPNILPADKGYLRTQKAIEGEVSTLRGQVGKRLKGALQVVVDAKANKLYVKKGLKLLWQADVSVGRGGLLSDKKSGQKWQFVTPRGEFKVIGKGVNPKWRKPDWAFVEAGEPVPPPDDPSRFVDGELGAYVLNLGDGYLIHGTKNEELLGRPASHGCVRVGAADLERLYATIPVGTKVYIFE
ncbi:MAG TPA: L,D-transpeptidase [Elusimicrobiota bacterium]|nr:L,D-transpeptidase [Elusimicrobiota bacterium]